MHINRLRARYDHAALRPWLYVAGPMLSHGNAYANVRNGILAGESARKPGWHPIIPHLDSLVTMVGGEMELEEIMSLDFGLINRCDAVLFLEDWEQSTGAREEHAIALDCGKWVYYGLVELPKAPHVFHLSDTYTTNGQRP
jgi:hypothetical protein